MQPAWLTQGGHRCVLLSFPTAPARPLPLLLQPPYEARAWKATPCEDFSPLFSGAANQAQRARQQSRG